MVNKYWLSIRPCGCLESYQLDDGSILPPGEVNDFVRQAVAKGNRTELQECSLGGYPYRACELHNNEKERTLKKDCPHKTLRDWPDCYQDCDFNNSYNCPNGGTETIKTSPPNNEKKKKELAIEEFTKGGDLAQIGDTKATFTINGAGSGGVTEMAELMRRGPVVEGVHEEIRKIKTVFYHPELLFRPVADEVFLLKIPGVTIEWPENLTAEEALDAWVKREYDVRPMED